MSSTRTATPSLPFAVGDGAALRPSLEVGLRYDGGNAETGTGVEAGLSYTDRISA